MASISHDGNGSRRILFLQQCERAEGYSARLGKVTKRDAESFKCKLESLLSAKLMGNSPDRETSLWLSTLDDDLHAKLVAYELVEPRLQQGMPTLVEFVDRYIAKRTDTKPTTLIVYKRCRNLLAEYFKVKRLDAVTVADAKDFARWMKTKQKPLAENTARRMNGFVRQFINDAVDAELLVKNPFKSKDIKVAVRGDANGFRFLSLSDTVKLIDACPDSQWRLIVALSRFGGLRTPSETLALRWCDVDWQANTIHVTSPKTAHHDGHGERTIPLFGDLRPYLEEAFNPEDEFLITRYRDATQNMRTQFNRIVTKAGLKPWSQPFHAMRKTRQTELADRFPAHTVCGWLGNSEAVAREFYLKTTDEHHATAISADCMHSCMQNGLPRPGNASQAVEAGNEETPVLQGFTSTCVVVRKTGLDDIGLEPTTSTMSTWRSNQLS